MPFQVDLSKRFKFLRGVAFFSALFIVFSLVYGNWRSRGHSSVEAINQDSGLASEDVFEEEGSEVAGATTIKDFARCLSESGTKLYTTSECPYCQEQKDLFGNALTYVDDTDCLEMPDVCEAVGISNVPTWTFPDGSQASGVHSLEELSEKTGCSLP